MRATHVAALCAIALAQQVGVADGAGGQPPAAQGPPIRARCPTNIGITVADAEKTAAWYEATFGLARRKSGTFPQGKFIILGSPSLEVEIIQHEASVDARRELKFSNDYLQRGFFKGGFYVDDLDATIARLKERQVRLLMEDGRDPELHVRFALIADPDGNTIQLFQNLP